MSKRTKEQAKTCEFCGKPIRDELRKNRKFCSIACSHRAAHNNATLRLAMPLSKRFRKRQMFSNPLYFN